MGYRTEMHLKVVSVTSARYRDEVPDPIMRFGTVTVDPYFFLMDGNVRPYLTKIVDKYPESGSIFRMERLAYSIDRNPAENLREVLLCAVSARLLLSANLKELETTLVKEWS
ncbi:hypothetical protein NPIL_653991 [Nephila pilipes]|uniref:Uncharacterized protein n=1 Tax=Nephila pilipes TaxID=299642 RepID=A0A8X6MQ51_NEPPI|nr:hypothetical protein NPIL_653991 [Nephila pilipes]